MLDNPWTGKTKGERDSRCSFCVYRAHRGDNSILSEMLTSPQSKIAPFLRNAWIRLVEGDQRSWLYSSAQWITFLLLRVEGMHKLCCIQSPQDVGERYRLFYNCICCIHWLHEIEWWCANLSFVLKSSSRSRYRQADHHLLGILEYQIYKWCFLFNVQRG